MNQYNKIKYSIIARKQKDVFGLFVRITFQGDVSEINSRITVHHKYEMDKQTKFPVDSQKRAQLKTFLEQVKHYGRDLLYNDLLTHPAEISAAFKIKKVKLIYFMELFNDFILHQQAQVRGGNLKQGTLKNYYTTQKFLARFIQDCFHRKDIQIKLYNRAFLDKYYNWLTDNTVSTNNGKAKHFERLKRFTTLMTAYERLPRDPFLGFSLKKDRVARVFLTIAETKAIRDLQIDQPKYAMTRDLFIFICHTALSYSDLLALTEDKIEQTKDGKIIRGKRVKNGQPYLIPLTAEAERILKKYRNHPIARRKGLLLPVYENQVFNRQLKKIVLMTGISKTVTAHVGRHTFATTALTSGVPLVTIQRVMGHADIRMTQHYARLIDDKLLTDMQAFKKMMNNQPINNKPDYTAILRVV